MDIIILDWLVEPLAAPVSTFVAVWVIVLRMFLIVVVVYVATVIVIFPFLVLKTLIERRLQERRRRLERERVLLEAAWSREVRRLSKELDELNQRIEDVRLAADERHRLYVHSVELRTRLVDRWHDLNRARQ